MITIQMKIEKSLLDEVDRAAKLSGKSRSAFARDALRKSLQEIKEKLMEKKQIEGYRNYPVSTGEFSVRETEQVWVDW